MKRVSVRIPASTANLGPGFDALGLALELYTTLTFLLLDEDDTQIPLVTLEGELKKQLPADKTNLVWQLLSLLWCDKPELLSRVRINIASEIPLGRGLGSSAATTLGTVWAAAALDGGTIDNDAVLTKSAAFEGHPDNVAASLYGGLVVCSRSCTGNQIVTTKLTWPDEWCTLIVVPPYQLATKEARAVLPGSVPLADAVSNIQNVAQLISAVHTRDETALVNALHDRIHEPYRLRLVPELAELRAALANLPVLGCVLSGAGSAVLVVVQRRHKEQIVQVLHSWMAARKPTSQLFDLAVARRGIELI